MKTQLNKLFLLSAALASLTVTQSFADQAPDALIARSVCEKTEQWRGQGSLPQSAIDNLSSMLSGEITPALGLSRAYNLEKDRKEEVRLFGYYMEGRSLLLAGEEDGALESFSYVATSGPSNTTGMEVQSASMQCIARVLRVNPGITVPVAITSHLKSLSQVANARPYSDELALDVLMERISEGATDADLSEPLQALGGSGAFENVARGLIAAEHRDHAQVIANLSPIFPTTKRALLPEGLRREETRARLVLARSYYATRHFGEAIAQYQRIDHRSNEIAEVLSELSWSYLQQKRYGEAVGTSVNLRLGDMRGTFAPESLEVASMSLNELCQFQDSLRMVQTLERDYEPSYRWLKTRATSNAGPSLYSLAIASLKSDNSGVPAKVASEWIRSPLFLSAQSEIHRLFGVKQRYSALISAMKDELSSADSSDQESIRQAVLTLQQHQAAIAEGADRARLQWVDRIEAELTRRNARMLADLEDVRENSHMVKIEIFNGASHDMIWLRAHPEFKDGDSHQMMSEKDSPSGSDVWNWGKVDPNADHAEVWEDEIGSFRAHLQDHCSDKQRYLGVSGIATASR